MWLRDLGSGATRTWCQLWLHPYMAMAALEQPRAISAAVSGDEDTCLVKLGRDSSAQHSTWYIVDCPLDVISD